jgi:UDP-N-acetylglucosamine transferase subunit ALG13
LLDALRERSDTEQKRGGAVEAPKRPKLLIVPNRTLMDDHQAELAAAMAQHDYCATGDVACVFLVSCLSRSLTAARQHPARRPR